MKRVFASLTVLPLLFAALPTAAQEPSPDFLFSDRDLTDVSVPTGFSQKFIEARGGGIARMRFQDIDGSMRPPGDLIDYYGRVYGVNPRFLLALIQKEQSLVHDPSPSVCQIDWAAGYGRPDGSTCNDPAWQRYRGFTSQIVNAAAFVRFFYDKERAGEARGFGFSPGVAATIDGVRVTPANLATAILYTYTPHLHGNRNLQAIWSKWFSSSHPDGSYLSDADGNVYLIQGGLKRRFANKSALHSRVDPNRVIRVGDDVIGSYEDGAPIKFPDYALTRVPSGTVYLLVGDVKRPIESMKVFRSIGFNPEEIDDVDPADLEGYADGELISLRSAYPTGALLQDKRTGGVYFVENGVKHAIVSAEIMRAAYPGKKLTPVSKSALDQYPTGDPVKFRDGELITSPGSDRTVFVISNGMRRPIVSGEAFESLGYSWKRIIHTTDPAVSLHPLGEAVGAPQKPPAQVALAP
jgi:hypothetical protein